MQFPTGIPKVSPYRYKWESNADISKFYRPIPIPEIMYNGLAYPIYTYIEQMAWKPDTVEVLECSTVETFIGYLQQTVKMAIHNVDDECVVIIQEFLITDYDCVSLGGKHDKTIWLY